MTSQPPSTRSDRTRTGNKKQNKKNRTRTGNEKKKKKNRSRIGHKKTKHTVPELETNTTRVEQETKKKQKPRTITGNKNQGLKGLKGSPAEEPRSKHFQLNITLMWTQTDTEQLQVDSRGKIKNKKNK